MLTMPDSVDRLFLSYNFSKRTSARTFWNRQVQGAGRKKPLVWKPNTVWKEKRQIRKLKGILPRWLKLLVFAGRAVAH